MDVERWRKIEQLYHAALEREAGERPAFLQQACAGDEELLRKVHALLARDQQAENFLQPGSDGVPAPPALAIAAKALDGYVWNVRNPTAGCVDSINPGRDRLGLGWIDDDRNIGRRSAGCSEDLR